MFILLLVIRFAFAEILILSPTLSQEGAQELSQQCLTALEENAELEVRISRFFVSGEGYQYKVVVAGFAEEQSAHSAYKILQQVNKDFELQLDTQLFDVEKPENKPEAKEPKQDREKREFKRKQQRQSPEPEFPDETNDSEVEDDKKSFGDRLQPSSIDVLSHAKNAHNEARTVWSSSDGEHFVYTRKLPQEGVVVKHNFYRHKEAMRLDVDVDQGAAINSTTVLPEKGDGWVKSGDKVVSRNAIRTKELLERFSSKNILSIPFYFSVDVQTSSSWQEFDQVKDGGSQWILSANKNIGLIEAGFSKESWLLSYITVIEGGKTIKYEFLDYRGLSEAGVIPYIVRITNDGILAEEIKIERLDLNPDLGEDLFTESNPNK